ncbi:hypothetical protein MY10362_008730 [Beauveria mimosiformis]|uniref:Cysteine-rich transmembrane CYSTM domain-containing protein n=1 Tax=Beauveria brongniartii RCEF 3172 TaxID=1081107 RepID=A0A167H3D2_9HYPO|nr:hypothetical protein BBO_02892 [Beauveria brongniartii RCEF 3172]
MPSQEQVPQQQQPMAATNPSVEAARPSSEQPRPVEPMSVGLRGGHNGEGEAICCGLCAGLCCFECCECCC